MICRNLSSDVSEAMNLNSLEDLEDKFSHQAAITKYLYLLNSRKTVDIRTMLFSNSSCEEYTLPPQRTRKLPTRVKVPQLRLSIHQVVAS